MSSYTFDYDNLIIKPSIVRLLSGAASGSSEAGGSVPPISQHSATESQEQDAGADVDFRNIFLASAICYPRSAQLLVPEYASKILGINEYRYVVLNSGTFVIELTRIEGQPDLTKPQRCQITNAWKTTKWHCWRNLTSWFVQLDECYKEKYQLENGQPNPKWSFLLFMIGCVLIFLRRATPFELLKHLFPKFSGRNQTPAWFLDLYLLTFWMSLGLFVALFSRMPDQGFWVRVSMAGVVSFVILQLLQTSFYHEFWRARMRSPIETEKYAHSRLRNFVIGFANGIVVTVLFGLIYFLAQVRVPLSEAEKLVTPLAKDRSLDVLESIYFSYTIAWSVGPVGLSPNLSTNEQAIIVVQAACTLFIVGVLMSMLINSITPLPEKPEEKEKS